MALALAVAKGPEAVALAAAAQAQHKCCSSTNRGRDVGGTAAELMCWHADDIHST